MPVIPSIEGIDKRVMLVEGVNILETLWKPVLFFILIILIALPVVQESYGQELAENVTDSLNDVTQSSTRPVISVNTDKPKYSPGQLVRIVGNVSGVDGMAVYTNVILEARKTHDIVPNSDSLWPFDYSYVEVKDSKPLHRAVLLPRNGTYTDPVVNLGSGKYNVSALASLNGTIISDWTTLEVTDWMVSPTFLILVATLIFFAALIAIVFSFNERKPYWFEALRFICISGIALLPLTAFFLTDVEFGVNSLVGLIIKHQLDENGNVLLDRRGQPLSQWMINFGGDPTSNYQSGIQIPFYVFTFGLVGGYLRYLVKTFRKGGLTGIDHQKASVKELIDTSMSKAELAKTFNGGGQLTPEQKHIIDDEFRKLEKTQFLRETLSELAELMLAPVLAIAAYFLLYQGAAPNIYTTAIVSFTVGLVTKDFVDRLENVAREKTKAHSENKPGQTS